MNHMPEREQWGRTCTLGGNGVALIRQRRLCASPDDSPPSCFERHLLHVLPDKSNRRLALQTSPLWAKGTKQSITKLVRVPMSSACKCLSQYLQKAPSTHISGSHHATAAQVRSLS